MHAKGAGKHISDPVTLSLMREEVRNRSDNIDPLPLCLPTGAFGYLEVTHDISKYCKAKLFSQIGKKTPLAIRFSTVGGESGSADTVR